MATATDIIHLAEQYRAALARRDAVAVQRLVDAYGDLFRRLQGDIDALTLKIKTSGGVSRNAIAKSEQYRRLIANIGEELTRYQGWAGIEIGRAAREAIAAGQGEARMLVAAALGDMRAAALLRDFPPQVMETLLGFLDPRGPLYERLGQLANVTADKVAQAILEGVGLGQNPREIARYITRELGMGLTDSMRMMRTTQLYAYRETSRASYLANSDVVKGWIWYADLSQACPACIAEHGTVHDLDETLDDHYNGHCTAVPLVVGMTNDLQSGEDYFNGLPEAQQRELLGPGKFEAWQNGQFDFSQLSHKEDNDVFGTMRVETSLKDLVGAQAPAD